MLLQDAVNDFLFQKLTYCSARTVENYQEHLARFQQHAPAELADLTQEHIRTYIIKLKNTGCRNVSVNCYLRSIKVFCSWLYEEGHTDEYLFRKIKMLRSDAALKVPLSREEVKSIDAILGPRDKIIFYFMLDAGLRCQEVCKLKKTDVDLQNRLIYVNNSKYNKSRIVPMSENLSCLLRDYSQEKNKTYLLCSRTGTQMTANLVKQIFQDIKAESGVTRMHAHLLRHTFATSYIVGGGSMEKLRIMLGHSDYAVTQGYLHLAAQFEVVKYPIYRLDSSFFERGY